MIFRVFGNHGNTTMSCEPVHTGLIHMNFMVSEKTGHSQQFWNTPHIRLIGIIDYCMKQPTFKTF